MQDGERAFTELHTRLNETQAALEGERHVVKRAKDAWVNLKKDGQAYCNKLTQEKEEKEQQLAELQKRFDELWRSVPRANGGVPPNGGHAMASPPGPGLMGTMVSDVPTLIAQTPLPRSPTSGLGSPQPSEWGVASVATFLGHLGGGPTGSSVAAGGRASDPREMMFAVQMNQQEEILSSVRTENTHLQQEVGNLLSQIKQREEQRESAKKELLKKEEEAAQQRATLERAEEERDSLRREKTELEAKLEELQISNSSVLGSSNSARSWSGAEGGESDGARDQAAVPKLPSAFDEFAEDDVFQDEDADRGPHDHEDVLEKNLQQQTVQQLQQTVADLKHTIEQLRLEKLQALEMLQHSSLRHRGPGGVISDIADLENDVVSDIADLEAKRNLDDMSTKKMRVLSSAGASAESASECGRMDTRYSLPTILSVGLVFVYV